MKVLACRSEKENIELRNLLMQDGFDVITLNMIEYQTLSVDLNQYQQYQNVIITSKFAAQLLSQNLRHHINCFVVGKESALILSNNSYINVIKFYDNVDSLLQELHDNFNSENWIYYSGNIIAQNIPVTTVTIYNTKYKDTLNNDFVTDFCSRGIDVVLLHSKKIAESLFYLLESHKLLSFIKKSVVIGMSQRVVEPFSGVCKEVLYTQNRTQEEMVMLLRSLSR